jgi:hypothetical protein
MWAALCWVGAWRAAGPLEKGHFCQGIIVMDTAFSYRRHSSRLRATIHGTRWKWIGVHDGWHSDDIPIVSWQASPWAGSVHAQYVQVHDNQLYVTGLYPIEAGWTNTCTWFSVFRLNLTLPTAWNNVSEMFTTTPCKTQIFAKDSLVMRYYRPEIASRRSSRNAFLVFDLRTLVIQVREQCQ